MGEGEALGRSPSYVGDAMRPLIGAMGLGSRRRGPPKLPDRIEGVGNGDFRRLRQASPDPEGVSRY
jgi:hypothetical protein